MAQDTLAKKKQAYLLFKQGWNAKQVAQHMGVSVRMVYRYRDEYELHQLREFREQFKVALEIADTSQPLSVFLQIFKAQAKKGKNSEKSA